jgi:hypothetical protein
MDKNLRPSHFLGSAFLRPLPYRRDILFSFSLYLINLSSFAHSVVSGFYSLKFGDKDPGLRQHIQNTAISSGNFSPLLSLKIRN